MIRRYRVTICPSRERLQEHDEMTGRLKDVWIEISHGTRKHSFLDGRPRIQRATEPEPKKPMSHTDVTIARIPRDPDTGRRAAPRRKGRRSAGVLPRPGYSGAKLPIRNTPASFCALGLRSLFEMSAFSAWLSRLRSATICFSRRFSSSSCFNFFASLTVIPPHFAFQL